MAHTLQDKMAEKLEEGLNNSLSAKLSEKDDLTPEEIAALTPDSFVVVPYNEEEAERTGYSNYSYWGSTVRMFFKNKVAVAMLIVMCALLLFTIIQPYLPNQFDPYEVNYVTQEMVDNNEITVGNPIVGMPIKNMKPNSVFWFGTNHIGQDLWSNIWQGTRNSLIIGFTTALIEAVVGILVGLLWGGRLRPVTATAFLLLLYLAMLSAVAYSVWSLLLRHNDVSQVTVYGFATPLFGVILSAVLLDEGNPVPWLQSIAALLLTCVGIYIVNRPERTVHGMDKT